MIARMRGAGAARSPPCSSAVRAGPPAGHRCWRAGPAAGAAVAAAAGASTVGSAASNDAPNPAYPYNSGDENRQKATIEHIFGGKLEEAVASSSGGGAAAATATAARAAARPAAPWNMAYQMSERNMVWNDDLKLRLIKRIASQELGVTESELEEKLAALQVLLPGLATRLVAAPPQRVAQLAASVSLVAERIMRLKSLFPQANVSDMISGRLTLLLEDDLDEIAAAGEKLRRLLPGINVDRFVETFPIALNADDFEVALEDARRLMPDMNVARTLRSDPETIIMLMKGKSLVIYDDLPNPFT